MIDEKYKWPISIVCICLSIVLILSGLFVAPKNEKSIEVSSGKEAVLNKDEVTEINIEINESDWDWLIENAAKEEYRSANVTINGETFYNVGLRPKGNSSLSSIINDEDSDRFSFKIDFGQYVEGQNYHGFEKLVLNNMTTDTTYMKEYLSYGLYDSLGIATPEFSYSNIKINGKAWGLYLAVEVIEKNFIENEFGTTNGNLYKPESMEMNGGGNDKGGGNAMGGAPMGGGMPMGGKNFPNGGENGFQRPDGNSQDQSKTQVKGNENSQQKPNSENVANGNAGKAMGFGGMSRGGANLKYTDDNISSYSVVRDSAIFKTTTDQDFQKIIEMIKNLNDGTNLEEYLDVDEILKYFAVNTFLVNLDSYSGGMGHNYYLYEKDGKCTIIPWDLNMSFAGFSSSLGSGTSGAQKAVNFPIDSPVTGSLEDAPLIANLLKVDKYKELYHSYLQKIADEYFNNGTFENLIIKLDNLLGDYVKTDATAFYTYDEYKKSLTELIQFGKDRTSSIESQLSGQQPSTTYGDIETTVDLSSLGTMEMGGKDMGRNEQDTNKDKKNTDNSTSTTIENGQMPEMGGQMGAYGQMPPMDAEMPAMNGQAPSNDGQMPEMGGQMGPYGQMPPMDGEMPAMNGQAPSNGSQRPKMNGQMPGGNGKTQNGNKQTTDNNVQTQNGNQQTVNNNGKTSSNNEQTTNNIEQGLNMGNMPPMENMQEIMSIIKDKDVDNLTTEDKEKLKNLGVDENMLSSFKNMKQGGGPQMGGMPGMNNASTNGNMLTYLIEGSVLAVLLAVGFIFVFGYKRKRVSKK